MTDKKKPFTHIVLSKEMERQAKEALKKANKLNTNISHTNSNHGYKWIPAPSPQQSYTITNDSNDPYQRLRDEIEEIKERLKEIEELPIINLLKEGMRDDDEEEGEKDNDSES
jgi:ferritin